MKTRIIILAPALLLTLACGDDSSSTPDDTTGGETTGDESTGSTSTTSPTTTTTSPTNTGPADTTAEPPGDCDRTTRYTLYDNQACGRIFVGDIDGDAFTDLVAFGQSPDAVLTPITQTMHTFEGSGIGLQMAEVHCCTESSQYGSGAVFDINGDMHGDAIWTSERTVFSGDVGETELTIHKRVRGPERGWVGDGVVFAHAEGLPAPVFTIGRITPQETGVLVIADGALHSMRGTGDELGLETVSSKLLDPMPTIHALATVEFDGMQGVDVVGVGPDGLSLWGGSLEGTFADAVVTKLPGDYFAMQSIDTDLDGTRQVVLFGENEPVAFVDAEDGELVVTYANTPTLDRPGAVGAVDTGVYPDLVAKDGDNLVYYPGDGMGFGDPVVLAPIGDVAGIAFGDFDANGFEDVVACDEQGLLVVYHADE